MTADPCRLANRNGDPAYGRRFGLRGEAIEQAEGQRRRLNGEGSDVEADQTPAANV